MSRTCGGAVFFDNVEKEALRRLIWKMSDFLGVRVLTYCVMGNHFHVLIDVPSQQLWLKRFEGSVGEALLLKHLATFYSSDFMLALRNRLGHWRSQRQGHRAQEHLGEFTRRFCDLAIFGKELKERFTRWYNKRHERKGTLWMAPFKSVLVQDGCALKTMAAYIDLNPIRGSLVKDPKDYRWSGYSEAASGAKKAQDGLCRVFKDSGKSWDDRSRDARPTISKQYRAWLYEEGIERPTVTGAPDKKGFKAAAAHREMKRGLSPQQLVRRTVRQFSQGLALGTKDWLETTFEAHRERFGSKRKSGARRIRGADNSLATLRDLS